jgi:hypothetical protein
MQLLFAVALLVPSVALADVPPPDTDGCGSKAPNDACKTDKGAAGACVTKKCNRIDYTPKDAGSDGAASGGPSGTIEYDCLTCIAGAPVATTAAKSGCSVHATRESTAHASLIALGVAMALVVSRRKRSS